MDILKTMLGTDVTITTRGIVYLCNYDYENKSITVVNEILCDSGFDALNYYANIHNPESQLVQGKTFDELINNLLKLHENMKNPDWLEMLENCL